MINLGFIDRLIFAVPVPDWSKQHELVINRYSTWIKYPSPKGWGWLKLPLDENYEIIGLSTPNGLKSYPNIVTQLDEELVSTILRSYIITNANDFGVSYNENDFYLILEMSFLK